MIQILEPKKVTFESNGGTPVKSQELIRGQAVAKPSDPVKTDHDFNGWFTDNETFNNEWDFEEIPQSDLSLFAKWTEVPVIKEADITVTAPVKGESPDTSAQGSGNFIINTVSWSPNDSIFLGSTAYTVTIAITADGDYSFTGRTSASVNGNTAVITISSDGLTAVVSYQFAETEAKAVIDMTLVSPPDKLNYFHNDILDLSGLIINLLYDDGTSEDAALAEFALKDIVLDPENHTTLSHTDHNNQEVTVTLGSLSVTAGTLIVGKAPVTNAAVTVTSPQKGETPSSSATGGGNFSTGDALWSPADNTFRASTVYTVTVDLTADSNYIFTDTTTATVNGYSADITVSKDGETAVVTYQFAATGEKEITAISVKSPPSKLTYIYADLLDLSGLEVTLAYDDLTTEDVPLADFASKNISAEPADGSLLSRVLHNGMDITVSAGSKQAAAGTLTVDAKTLTVAGAAHTKIYDGTVAANGVTVTFDGIAAGDTVLASSVTANYTGADAGTTLLTITGVTIAGEIADNYTVTLPVDIDVEGITKAPGAAVGVPVLLDYTDSPVTITVSAVPAPVNGQTVEYNISTSDDGTGLLPAWQASTTFGGLSLGTVYYVYARSSESANYYAGISSVSSAISINTVGITLSVAQITEGAPLPDNNITISRSGNGSNPVTYPITIAEPNLYDEGSIRWEIAGSGAYTGITVTESGASFTLDAKDVRYNSLGGHTLTLEVRIKGTLYRRNINFTVVE